MDAVRDTLPNTPARIKDGSIYVPWQLVSELSTHKDLTARFHAAIVFTDVVDSMNLMRNYLASRSLGAERLGKVLDQYYASLFETVHAFGGEVLRLDGDAMIAFWTRQTGGEANAHVKAAASAAWQMKSLCLQTDKDMRDHPHRVTLACGDVTAEIFQAGKGRAFVTMQGRPLVELGGPLGSGQPATVSISATAARALGSDVTVVETDNGIWEVTSLNRTSPASMEALPQGTRKKKALEDRLLSPFVREHLNGGLAGWIAERRFACVAQVGVQPSKNLKLGTVIETVHRTLKNLNAGIWDITISDKGPVLTVIFGLPPFSKLTASNWTVQAADDIAEKLKLQGADVKIGIASGEFLLGDVGTATRRSEFLFGSAMARATRLMQASNGDVLCDAQTVQQCARRFDFGPAQEVVIKAKERPISARALIGHVPVDRLDDFSAPAIGRSAEKQMLVDLFKDQDTKNAKFLFFEGEPGSGKSHLLRDANQYAESFGQRALNVTCSPIDSTSPYFAFRSVLPKHLGVGPKEQGSHLEAAIALALDGHPLSRNTAAVQAAAEIVTTAGSGGGVAAEARASQAEDVVVELFRRMSAVIIVDDAQWLDTASSNLLRALLERVDGMRLIAATRRKEDGAYLPDWLTAHAEIARLDRLGGDDIDAFVRRLLAVSELPKQLSEFIRQRADGIPLFAEQIVFDLKQRNLVSVANNRVAFRIEDISTLSQPTSLRELIANRVDLLSNREQIILKAASVVGHEFPVNVLAKISPLEV
ncbi:MAG: AAA family ATPase, partial [Roseobacter sp.]|nr:AAA family ATPase [Roseobacter sp.]